MKKNWFETTGTLVYDPPRDGMKTRTQNWCVINADPGIYLYYQWLMKRSWWEIESTGVKRPYARPAWDAHVSLIRGEKISQDKQHLWKKYDGKQIRFKYSNWIEQTGGYTEEGYKRADHFWFIRVECDWVWKMREELGLPIKSPKGRPYSLHLTVARAFQETTTRNRYQEIWYEPGLDPAQKKVA